MRPILSNAQRCGRVAAVLATSCWVSQPAHASDWGCQVLLCLSNPAGATAVAECVPPIQRLWAALAKWNPDPFPSCEQARPGGAWAERTTSWYDPCPEGTTALGAGLGAIDARDVETVAGDSMLPMLRRGGMLWRGIGDGASAVTTSEGAPIDRKVCVGRRVGTAGVVTDNGEGSLYTNEIPVYDRIATLDPATSPRAINVYVDHRLARVVRYGAPVAPTAPSADSVNTAGPTDGVSTDRTLVYPLAGVVHVRQGADALMPLRFYGAPMPWVTKPAAHLVNAAGVTLDTRALDVGNHYWQLPSDRWSGFLQFSYPYLVNARYIPPGTYTIRLLMHQGVAPYTFDPGQYQCAPGVRRVDHGCDVGTMVVEASTQPPSDALTRPQGYTLMSGVPWQP